MSVDLNTAIKQLGESGILAPGKLEDFIPPKANPASVEELVRGLVKEKQLTRFQAAQVAAGRAKSLILGGYTILDKIGAGGMGQVFKALHRRMDRLVAIKTLPSAMTKDPAAVARFEREVRAAAKLLHPNIVSAFDADQAGSVHFLVMEYVEGQDLSALVKKNGPLSVDKAVSYILQAARGLEYAHKNGVVHRDIKPGNLLLAADDTVKILDMGLARIESGGITAAQAELTGTGAVMGTVDYMAPEQAMNTKYADARADIYSLGCSLYYLLAGKAIYDGETVVEKLIAHREQSPPVLAEIRPDVPEELAAIFEKMVAKSIDDRYQSMTDVIADLQTISASGTATFGRTQQVSRVATSSSTAKPLTARSGGHAATMVTNRTSVQQPADKLARPALVKWLAVAAVSLVVALVAVIVAKQFRPAPDEESPVASNGGLPLSSTSPPVEPSTSDGPFVDPQGTKPPVIAMPMMLGAMENRLLPGLIFQPAQFPGIRRWQLISTWSNSYVKGLSSSRDGKWLAMASDDGVVRIYETDSWTLRRCIPNRGFTHILAWNHNSRRLAITTQRPDVLYIVDMDSASSKSLPMTYAAGCLAWSTSEDVLAFGVGNNSEIKLWRVDDKASPKTLKGHTDGVRWITWSPDGSSFISASKDKTLHTWSADGTPGPVRNGHTAAVNAVGWSKLDQIASLSADKTLRIWPNDLAAEPTVLPTTAIFLEPGSDGKTWMLRHQSGAWIGPLDQITKGKAIGGNSHATDIRYLRNHQAVGGNLHEGSIYLFSDNVSTKVVVTDRNRGPAALAVHPDGKRWVTGPYDDVLQVWSSEGRLLETTGKGKSTPRVRSMAYSPDGKLLAVASDNDLRILRDSLEISNIGPAKFTINEIAWGPGGKQVAAACRDGVVRIWNVDGSAGPELKSPGAEVTRVAWGNRGTIASVSRNPKTMLRFEALDGRPAREVATPWDCGNLAWSPDGGLLAIEGSDGQIHFWDEKGEAVRATSLPRDLPVQALSWSPDGKFLASAYTQNPSSGQPLQIRSSQGTLDRSVAGEANISALAWSGGGQIGAIGNGTFSVWDAASGNLQWTAVPLNNNEYTVFAPTGAVLESAGDVERDFAFLVERELGQVELFKPSEFQKLIGITAQATN